MKNAISIIWDCMNWCINLSSRVPLFRGLQSSKDDLSFKHFDFLWFWFSLSWETILKLPQSSCQIWKYKFSISYLSMIDLSRKWCNKILHGDSQYVILPHKVSEDREARCPRRVLSRMSRRLCSQRSRMSRRLCSRGARGSPRPSGRWSWSSPGAGAGTPGPRCAPTQMVPGASTPTCAGSTAQRRGPEVGTGTWHVTQYVGTGTWHVTQNVGTSTWHHRCYVFTNVPHIFPPLF